MAKIEGLPVPHPEHRKHKAGWLSKAAAAVLIGVSGVSGGVIVKELTKDNALTDRPAITEPQVTVQPTAEVKPTEIPFPYELYFKEEFKGPENTVTLAIEKKLHDTLGTNAIVPYAGATHEQIAQGLNDVVLQGDLYWLHKNSEYKDLTLEGLKKLIHEGRAPKYNFTVVEGPNLVDTGKPITFTAISEYGGLMTYTDGIKFDYVVFPDGSRSFGIWNRLGFVDPKSRVYDLATNIASSFLAPDLSSILPGPELDKFRANGKLILQHLTTDEATDVPLFTVTK